MKIRRKYFAPLISIVSLIIYLLIHKGTEKPVSLFTPSATQYNKQSIVKVIEVIDGDTIVIEGGKKLRYIGIDTPETKHPKKGAECFGKEASEKNRELVENKLVILEKDVSETDRYDRLLRYVWLADTETSSKSAVFVNDFLARQGYAYAATFPPDVKYSKEFKEAQQEARENNRGLWKGCSNK